MGNVTTTTYDSTGIFPSSIQHNGSLTDYYTYDANTGSLLAHVDPNGSSINDTAHKTSYSYDAIGRLTKVVYPPAQHGTPETNICYTDVGGASCAAGSAPYSVYTANLMSTGRNGSTLIQTYDGLGKISATVAPSGAITNTSYDSDGRIYSVTNPYYTTNDSTYGTVYYSYDALDRKVEQIQQSGATQTWQYTGNTTLFSDEKVVHWSRTADALGRLVKVLEPNGAGTGATMETDYSYDALGNLVSVVQMGRSSSPVSRSFTYDSISRLLTASNPETGTVCYGVWNGSACSDGYDANGNLLYRTDARGVVTTYAYDTFNRLTSKMYSDGATPASCYQYYTSSPANGIGRLFNAWTQKAGTSCSSSPQDGDYLSLNSILSYDALGHPVSMLHKHCIGAACTSSSPYSLAMDYDLAGNVIGLSNSAGANGASLALSSTFDSASRLCLMTSSWNVPNSSGSATVPQNLFQSDPSNGYLALGTLHAWYLGSNGTSVSPDCSGQISAPISVQQEYTNRQWLQSIQAVKQP
jgi:YD repeat-containing protein